MSTPQELQAIYDLIAGYQAASAIAAVATIALIGVVIAWVVWEKWFTPWDSKAIRTAARKKRPLEFVAGDDGYLDLIDAEKGIAEGVLETSKIAPLNKLTHIGALPRPIEFTKDQIEVDAGKDADKTVKMANFVSRMASRRLTLRGAKVPVWLVYRGKGILTSLYGLIALQIVEGLADKAEQISKEFAAAWASVDVVAIKDLFKEQWDESQIQALAYEKERKGEAKARRFGGKESLTLIFALLICLVVVAIILVAVAYFFTQ